MSEMTLRVGMIGHGFMGKTHGHAYRSLRYYYDPPPATVVLAGVATRTEASWRAAVKDWGYQFGTTNPLELCARDDIDIIHIPTPPHWHALISIAAMQLKRLIGNLHAYPCAIPFRHGHQLAVYNSLI